MSSPVSQIKVRTNPLRGLLSDKITPGHIGDLPDDVSEVSFFRFVQLRVLKDQNNREQQSQNERDPFHHFIFSFAVLRLPSGDWYNVYNKAIVSFFTHNIICIFPRPQNSSSFNSYFATLWYSATVNTRAISRSRRIIDGLTLHSTRSRKH